jgi:hypothetical protein
VRQIDFATFFALGNCCVNVATAFGGEINGSCLSSMLFARQFAASAAGFNQVDKWGRDCFLINLTALY